MRLYIFVNESYQDMKELFRNVGEQDCLYLLQRRKILARHK